MMSSERSGVPLVLIAPTVIACGELPGDEMPPRIGEPSSALPALPADTMTTMPDIVAFMTAWQSGSVAGILLASRIPEGWGIGFAGTLALLAITIPLVINLAAAAGVLVAGFTAVAAAGLPFRLGLLLAVLLGMAAALTVDAWSSRRSI